MPINNAYSQSVHESLSSGYATLRLATIGTTPLRFTATATRVASTPMLRADPGNGTGIVYLIAEGGAAAGGVPLAAGDSIPVPVDDLSKIWVVGSTTNLGAAIVAGV